MTTKIRPDFLDSEYFYIDENGGWQLRDDAPKHMKKAFKEYMEDLSTFSGLYVSPSSPELEQQQQRKRGKPRKS